MSTLSSRMRQFGPSRDYPYALPGEFSEEEEAEEEEEEEQVADTEKKEEEKEEDKVEIKQEEAKEEKNKKDGEKDDSASTSCRNCSCGEIKKQEKAVGIIKEKAEEIKEPVEVNEMPKIQELNLKMNPMKTMIATKIDRGNHISSRFY